MKTITIDGKQWQLVPVEPTDTMLYMIVRAIASKEERIDSYHEMLAAAPEAPAHSAKQQYDNLMEWTIEHNAIERLRFFCH